MCSFECPYFFLLHLSSTTAEIVQVRRAMQSKNVLPFKLK